jgi:hypothetical protein
MKENRFERFNFQPFIIEAIKEQGFHEQLKFRTNDTIGSEK